VCGCSPEVVGKMSTDDLILTVLVGIFFSFLSKWEKAPPKYYSCPEYCSVIHTHIGAKYEEKEPNEQGPLPSDKFIAYDDEPTNASDNDDIGSSE